MTTFISDPGNDPDGDDDKHQVKALFGTIAALCLILAGGVLWVTAMASGKIDMRSGGPLDPALTSSVTCTKNATVELEAREVGVWDCEGGRKVYMTEEFHRIDTPEMRLQLHYTKEN